MARDIPINGNHDDDRSDTIVYPGDAEREAGKFAHVLSVYATRFDPPDRAIFYRALVARLEHWRERLDTDLAADDDPPSL